MRRSCYIPHIPCHTANTFESSEVARITRIDRHISSSDPFRMQIPDGFSGFKVDPSAEMIQILLKLVGEGGSFSGSRRTHQTTYQRLEYFSAPPKKSCHAAPAPKESERPRRAARIDRITRIVTTSSPTTVISNNSLPKIQKKKILPQPPKSSNSPEEQEGSSGSQGSSQPTSDRNI